MLLMRSTYKGKTSQRRVKKQQTQPKFYADLLQQFSGHLVESNNYSHSYMIWGQLMQESETSLTKRKSLGKSSPQLIPLFICMNFSGVG